MTEKLVPDFTISIDESPLPPELLSAVVSVEVEQSLSLVDMFTITSTTPGAPWATSRSSTREGRRDRDRLRGRPREDRPGRPGLARAGVAAGEQAVLILRGYDKAHKLRRGKKTRTFLEAEGERHRLAARERGGPLGRRGRLPAGPRLPPPEQRVEHRLHPRARPPHLLRGDRGREELSFKKPTSNKPKSAALAWGTDRQSFHVKLSNASLPTAVTTLGWDPKQKKAITGKSNSLYASMGPSSVTDSTKKAFGDAPHQISIRPVSDTGEAEALSLAILNERAMDAIQGHGTALGET